jgi:hypothetical protein
VTVGIVIVWVVWRRAVSLDTRVAEYNRHGVASLCYDVHSSDGRWWTGSSSVAWLNVDARRTGLCERIAQLVTEDRWGTHARNMCVRRRLL